MLEIVFGKPVYVTPSTTLGHIAAIPLLMEKGDAVIMDQQVHNSVKTAVQLIKPEGVHTEIIKHNRMDTPGNPDTNFTAGPQARLVYGR